MTGTFRASFDPLFHKFEFGFAKDGDALRYMQGFLGSPTLRAQATHELTHFYFGLSPVTRALRLLRCKALIVLIAAAEQAVGGELDQIDKQAVYRAVTQWRIAEATTQLLLPIYEGAALLAEFDCPAVPIPEPSDIMTFQMVLMEQCVAQLRAGTVDGLGRHADLGVTDPEMAALLDAISDHLLDADIVNRKLTLLNLPLNYDRPADCYLVAWLFVRKLHEHLSATIDRHIHPAFLVKYLRSYFFEDWRLVALILRVIRWEDEDNGQIIEHLWARMIRLVEEFSLETYEAYRAEIGRLQREPGANMEFLPGLLLEMPVEECHEIAMDLWKGTYEDLANGTLSERQEGVAMALQQLLNRQVYVPIHSGTYDVERLGDSVVLTADGLTLRMALSDDVDFAPQSARVTFFLNSGGERLQRMARIHLEQESISAWIGGREAPAASILAITGAAEASEAAEAYIADRLSLLHRLFEKQFAAATFEGTTAGRTLFLDWLDYMGGLYASLLRLSEALGYAALPRATFARLLRTFLTEEQLERVVRRSIAFGIGYNVGTLAHGDAREHLLDGSNFVEEFELDITVREKAGFDLQFFYIEELDDGWQLPRYYF